MAGSDLSVVGGAIGGAAAALRAAQYNLRTTWLLIDEETWRRSRAAYVSNVDNMIGVHSGLVLAKASTALAATHPRRSRSCSPRNRTRPFMSRVLI